MHVSHSRSPFGHQTACGQLWQVWQAPEVYADGSLGTLPGPTESPDGEAAACPLCDALLPDLERRWREGHDERNRQARTSAQERGAATLRSRNTTS